MNSNFFKFAVAIMSLFSIVFLTGDNCQARTADKPLIVRKKIVEHRGEPAMQKPKHGRHKPAIQPKSEISGLKAQNQQDELIAVAAQPNEDSPAPYDPTNKVDPFEPLLKEDAPRPKPVGNTPLERVDLSQLKLTAVVLAESGSKGLVEEATGKGYIISVGTPIGLYQGKVSDIFQDKVLVEEQVQDVFGRACVRTSELRLPKPAGK